MTPQNYCVSIAYMYVHTCKLLPSTVIMQSDDQKQHRIDHNADCKIKQIYIVKELCTQSNNTLHLFRFLVLIFGSKNTYKVKGAPPAHSTFHVCQIHFLSSHLMTPTIMDIFTICLDIKYTRVIRLTSDCMSVVNLCGLQRVVYCMSMMRQ